MDTACDSGLTWYSACCTHAALSKGQRISVFIGVDKREPRFCSPHGICNVWQCLRAPAHALHSHFPSFKYPFVDGSFDDRVQGHPKFRYELALSLRTLPFDHAARRLFSIPVQVHRLRALILLHRFLELGPWAVSLSLSVGVFPYVLKLMQQSVPGGPNPAQVHSR